MFAWSAFPLIRISIVLMLGISCAALSKGAFFPPSLAIALSLSLWGVAWAAHGLRWSAALVGNLLLLGVFVVGYYHYAHYTTPYLAFSKTHILEHCKAYSGQVTGYPKVTPKGAVYEIMTAQGVGDSACYTLEAKVLVYVKPDSLQQIPNLRYGDQVLIASTPSRIKHARNPFAFDYAKYMANQNVYFQDFTEATEVKVVGKDRGNPVLALAFKFRKQFEDKIQSSILDPKERGIILALLLGIKDQLAPEIKEAYAAAGAMHVLAVSGFHVGIIYYLTTFLMRLFPSFYGKKNVQATLCLVALWCYALLTGLYPSIFRAVLMFSAVLAAQIFDRKSNVYNALALAAMVLLFHNPSYLFAVGFQLSFIAVLGIVYIYPHIYALFKIPYQLLDRAWALTCVSIAAQVSTFPLSIYYFHQFPTYFLLSNLVVVLGAFLVMMIGIVMLGLSNFNFSDYLAQAAGRVAGVMNEVVSGIKALEGSVLSGLYLSATGMILIYTALLLLLALLYFKKMEYAVALCLVTMLYSIDRVYAVISQAERQELVFYSIKNAHVVGQVDGLKVKLFSTERISDHHKLKVNMMSYRLHRHLPMPELPDRLTSTQSQPTEFIRLAVALRQKLLYLTKPFDSQSIQSMIHADYVIISHHAVKSLHELTQFARFRAILLDHSNGFFYRSHIKAEGKDLGLKVYDLNEKACLIPVNDRKNTLR